MADTGLPHAIPYLLAADPPSLHGITTAQAPAIVAALARVTGGLQEGVLDAGSFEVTQASGGASTSVDVASNVGAGGYVQNDSATGQALGYLAPTGAKTTVTITAAHATLPRVDAVVVSLAGVVSIVAGTATSGATLDNARDGSHGGASIPSSALHLADLLVPATDTTIANAQIRDRRKWARGAHSRTVLATSGITISSTNWALVSSSLSPRIECSGVPVRVTFTAQVTDSASFGGRWTVMVNNTGVDATGNVGASSGGAGVYRHGPNEQGISFTWEFVPAAGSNVIAPASALVSTGSYSILSDADTPILWTVEEIVRQNTANNVTTTG